MMKIGVDAQAAEKAGDRNGTYIRNLLFALARIDDVNDYVLYAADAAHPFYARFRYRPNFTVRQLGSRKSFLGTYLCLGETTFRDGLDVLHVQHLSPFVHQGAMVATLHQVSFLRYPGFYSRGFVRRSRWLMGRTARRSVRIITASFHSKKDIVQAYGVPYRNVETVPYGVSAVFRPDHDPAAIEIVKKKYGVAGPYFLCLGRLNPRKNFFTALRAYELLQRRDKMPHKLVVSGQVDPQIPRMADGLRASSNPGLVTTGFVEEEDLPLIMAGASAVVYLAFIEGTGLPVLEAMASGVPVVASNTSNLSEIAEGASLTVSPLDVAQTAEAMKLVATEEEIRLLLRQRGLERAAEFSWDRAARRTLKIFQDL